MKKRVAFIEQESEMGGVEVSTLETVTSLDGDIFDCFVICPKHGELPDKLMECGTRVKILRRLRLFSVSFQIHQRYFPNLFALFWNAIILFQYSYKLKKILINEVDIVVTKGLMAHFCGGFAANMAGIPCIWHLQEVINSTSLNGFYQKILNYTAKRWASYILVDAESVGKQFDPYFHETGIIQVIYNGVDLENFTPKGKKASLSIKTGNGQKTCLICQVGRIVPIKGQHVLIEAFVRVCEKWSESYLLFAGSPLFGSDHYMKQLLDLVNRFDLQDRIYFLGYYPDLPSLLRAIDIFVHPAIEADSPLSVIEAMASERPIIASRVPGLLELFQDGEEGFFVPPDDPIKLAERLDELISDSFLRERLGKRARKAAEKRFNKKNYSIEFSNILHKIAN